MSYTNERKVHSFNQILKDIKAGGISSACLLFGTEQYLVSWAKQQLINTYVNEATKTMDLVVFETGEFDLPRFKEACETLPLFSERKVVILEGFDAVWGKYSKSVSQSDSDAVAGMIPELSPQTLVVITSEEDPDPKKKNRPKLLEALKNHGNVYDFDQLSDQDLKKFVNKRFREAGRIISPRALDALINNSGYFNKNIDYALYNLKSDIMKIIALSDSEEITEKDVIEGISDNLEHNVFKMLDSISGNRKETAFKLLNEMLLSGGNVQQILATIIGQLEMMLQVKELNEQGMKGAAISKKIGVHEFRVKKATGFVSNYTVGELRRILKNAFETDFRIKSGVLDGKLALEMLIAEI